MTNIGHSLMMRRNRLDAAFIGQLGDTHVFFLSLRCSLTVVMARKIRGGLSLREAVLLFGMQSGVIRLKR